MTIIHLLGFQFPTKRSRICLTVPNYARAIEQGKAMKWGEDFLVKSDPVEVAGFQWKLEAYDSGDLFIFHLCASPPAECAFEFQVEYSFHLLGNTPSRDIHKIAEGSAFSDEDLVIESWEFKKEEDMATFPHNFLQPDGSIHAELDFAIKSAKFCWDNEENQPLDAAAHVDVPAGSVEQVQHQPDWPMDA